MNRKSWILPLIAFCFLVPFSGSAERIDLSPEGQPWWGARNLFAPFSSVILGPKYYYGERSIVIDTTPPDATLDLFYLRATFQKRYEQTTSPTTVVLPRRIDASPRDAVVIRASLEGFRGQDRTIRVASREDSVELRLEPLPNTLRAVAHTYLGGRGSLTFLTDEALNIRIQKDEESGYRVFLNATAKAPGLEDTLQGIHSSLIKSLVTQQLGEDLLVRVELTDSAKKAVLDVRSRKGHDPYRDIQTYTLDFVPQSGESKLVAAVKAALAKVSRDDVTECALIFDDGLREGLAEGPLNRALSPRGEFTDPYLRAAMKRLGEVSPGSVITMQDGSKLNSKNVLELTLALSQPAQAKGYLSLLRSFIRGLEGKKQWRDTLRGLIAPEIGSRAFNEILDRAMARERSCMLRKIGASAAQDSP